MNKPEIAQTSPYKMDVSPGKYAWCSCGKSQKQPLCDGSHKGSEFKPLIETIEEEKTVYWCGCKHTKSAPFCDGSHNQL